MRAPAYTRWRSHLAAGLPAGLRQLATDLLRQLGTYLRPVHRVEKSPVVSIQSTGEAERAKSRLVAMEMEEKNPFLRLAPLTRDPPAGRERRIPTGACVRFIAGALYHNIDTYRHRLRCLGVRTGWLKGVTARRWMGEVPWEPTVSPLPRQTEMPSYSLPSKHSSESTNVSSNGSSAIWSTPSTPIRSRRRSFWATWPTVVLERLRLRSERVSLGET